MPPRCKILFLAANPTDVPQRLLDEEARAIDLALRQAQHRDDFELVQHWSVRTRDLQELLLRHRPEVVHFSGQGGPAGEIVLQEADGTARVAPPALIDEVLGVTRSSLPTPDVVNKLAENSVLGSVLAAGLRSVIAEPRITETALRQALEHAGRTAVHRTEHYLTALGTIASAAPLLGLFGTIVGMIEIFGAQAPSGGTDPQQLAHGISVALYNTAFGLIVAIPSLMFYRYFRTRVDYFQLTMELAAERLVPHLMRFAVRGGPVAP